MNKIYMLSRKDGFKIGTIDLDIELKFEEYFTAEQDAYYEKIKEFLFVY